MVPPVVLWFRRDLRLTDHPALLAAQSTGRPVVPLFVVDPAFARSGAPRRAHLHDALAALDASMGGALVYRHGEPVEQIVRLVGELGADTVFVSRDYGPYGRRRDTAVHLALADRGANLVGVGSPYAVAPGTVTKGDGTPYAVFTPFSKAWRAAGWTSPQAAPDVDWMVAAGIHGDGPPPRPVLEAELPEAGEVAAWRRWETFAGAALGRYTEGRNETALAGTSLLSTDLRWGVVHPRQLLAELQPCRDHDVFASELAWREFYADVLFRQPHTAWSNLNPAMDAMVVDTDAAARARCERWATGMTGYPIVDAGMHQLAATGWMHNRVRMIAASFLVKDLHLPWQWGARHFMDHLVDGDLASNSHGWQWTAGTGTDAAPYFRVFNPSTQAGRYDPDGVYVDRWAPPVGGRPSPMVDHGVERGEALARYQHARPASR